MPLGKEHRNINMKVLLVLLVLVTVAWLVTNDRSFFRLILGFLFATYIMHPDMDQYEVNRTGDWWKRYWYFYAVKIEHRNFWSHFPVVGTFGRRVYLMPIVLFVEWVFTENLVTWNFDIPNLALNLYINGFLIPIYFEKFWFMGECLADTVHFILDITGTEAKTINRRLGKKHDKRNKN